MELRGQGDAAHQPVVGVHGDPEGELAQQPDRMLLDRRRGPGLHVGGRAHLQRDPPVPHVAREAAEFHGAAGGDLDVIHDAHPVPEPLGAAPLKRLPDRREAEALPGVDRDVEVLPRHVLEGVEVAAGRPARLGAGDVEPGHAAVAVPHREFGDLQRARRRAHGGEQGVDGDATARAAGPEALEHRLDHLVEAQPARHVQFRGEPDLCVDHTVGGEVLRALGRHPDQGVAGLHDRHRVLEGVQVEVEVTPVGAALEPLLDLGHVVRGQLVVADLLGQVHDRGRPQPAIEMIMKQHLGSGADLTKTGRHPPIVTQSYLPPSRALRMVVPEARRLAEGRLVLGAGTPLRRLGLRRAGGAPASAVRRSARRLRRAAKCWFLSIRLPLDRVLSCPRGR